MSETSTQQTVTRAAQVLAPVPIAAIGGMVADDYVSSVLIWGGSKCDTVNGVQGCFGYLPGGFFLLLAVSAVIVGSVGGRL